MDHEMSGWKTIRKISCMNLDRDCLSLVVLSGNELAAASGVFLTGDHSGELAASQIHVHPQIPHQQVTSAFCCSSLPPSPQSS